MFRARLRARLCRGKEGLHRAPTCVRQLGGYTHILLLFLSSAHYCPFFHPLLSEIYPYHSSTLKRRPQTPVTAADLVWVCAPPRTIRKWLRRLAFRSLRTRAQDPCSCCCRPGVGLRPAADHLQMVTTPGVLDLVVVVVFTFTDRASTIPSNIRGCQSGTWSQRGTKVNGSHHGDNPLLKQGSKSRQKVMRLYKRWHRPIAKRFIKLPLLHIESSLDRLGLLSPTHDQRSQQQIGQTRSNQF